MAEVRYLFLFILLFAFGSVQAQEPQQSAPLEMTMNPSTTDVEVLALPDSTLLVYAKKNNIWRTKAEFAITKYDKNLKEVWRKELSLKAEDYYLQAYLDKEATYLAFGGDDQHNFKFMRVDNATGAVKITEHKLEAIRSITGFHVLQGRYFLVGEAKNDRNPLLLYLNPVTNEAKPLPAIYGYESTVSDIRINPDHQRVDVVLTESNNRISRLQVKSFDVNGNLISNHFILQQDDKSLLNAAVTPGDTATRMLIGIYGAGNLQLSQGFFTAPVVSHQVADGEFYPFLDLRNSFKYMAPRREQRVRRKEAERLQIGKQPSYRHKLLLHELIATPEGYILTAEAYVTQRGSSTRPLGFRSYTYNQYLPYFSEGNGLDVYKHTHALTMKFDKNGVLLWDNLLPLKDIITATATKSIETTYTTSGNVVAVYFDDDEIYYYIMEKDKFSDEHKKLELVSLTSDGKSEKPKQLSIIPWYPGSFVAFGFKSNKGSFSEDNSIFFINSVGF